MIKEIKKYTNLNSLIKRTKSSPHLRMEMLSLYLQQTPTLIENINEGFKNEDWNTVYVAAHKMIPSFSIVGMSSEYETLIKKVQNYANTRQKKHTANKNNTQEIKTIVKQLTNACTHACSEIKAEYTLLKKMVHEN